MSQVRQSSRTLKANSTGAELDLECAQLQPGSQLLGKYQYSQGLVASATLLHAQTTQEWEAVAKHIGRLIQLHRKSG